MNLVQIQPLFYNTLKAYAPFAPFLASEIVLKDDGTYPKTPGREAALQGKGLCITVWDILPDGVADAARAGATIVEIYVPVVIEENVKINRSASGTQIEGAQALQHCLEAMVGQPRSTPGQLKVRLYDPPFQNFGTINGVRRIVANFCLPIPIMPN